MPISHMDEAKFDPVEIERASYDLVRSMLPNTFGGEREYEIAVRVAHATGDIQLASELVFHPDFVRGAMMAIVRKLPIFTDTEMSAVVLRKHARDLGVEVVCAVDDPDVILTSRELRITKAMASVRKVMERMKVGLVVCGNSPTFLYELMRFCESEAERRPLAVIGLPVGFVFATEVKSYLIRSRIIPFVSNASTKGGTPAAVSSAICIMRFVREEFKNF